MKKYSWNTHPELRKAVQCIVEGDSFHMAYKKTRIGAGTIKKFYLQYVSNPKNFKVNEEDSSTNATKCEREITVFTPEQETVLMTFLKHFEYLFYGLSEKECRMLAYQMVISEDMKIPLGWKHGMASIAWLISFQLKHSSLMNNLEKPDRICTRYKIQRYRKSVDRNVMWEKKTVTTFYDDLESLIQKSAKLKDNKRIFSLDEEYMSVNPDRHTVDRESRRDLLTTCCFIRADGTSMPPVIIKPYLPYVVCSDIPPGASVLTGSLGRMTPDLFTEVMHHFVNHSESSLINPSILIMDTDLCHLSYSALSFAKESGVHILTLHPHVSKLLQPLQGEIFDTFLKFYYEDMEAWWNKQEKDTASGCDFGKFVRDAYAKSMTFENIANGFKKCGISPFDRDLFTFTDYLSCLENLEQTCIECRLRDGRSRQTIIPEESADYDEARCGSSDEEQVEISVKPDDDDDGGESSQSHGTKTEEQMAGSGCANMTKPRTQNSHELDKLKRRLIRSVARLIKEKKSEGEVWDELKKECGNNCKTLWVRMRSLTLKKLKRLLDAEDRNEHVPAVARMTLTDWLLYDLVLVHEKIDVINRSESSDNKVLNNLFSLVQLFQIEGRSGDDLAEAWTAATVSYNSKGHQCSPMLMQRRWYQIKELTRHKLYQFWFNYRGNERLLTNAKQDPPTALQRAIALRYPGIITKQFPSWEDRVEQGLVIMPEEFEVKMRKKDLMKPIDETVPDIVIVEQKIDTITVDSDSEFEDEENGGESAFLDLDFKENDESIQTPVIVQVKTEPEDDNIDITEHPVYPEEPKDRFEDAIEKLEIEENRIRMSHNIEDRTSQVEDYVMPLITNVTGAIDKMITTQDISMANNYMEIDSENSTKIINTEQDTIRNNLININKELEDVINTFNDDSQESIVIDDDDDDIKLTKEVAQKRSNTPGVNQIESNIIDITNPKAVASRDDNNRVASTVQKPYTIPITDTKVPTGNNELFPIITEIASGSPVKAKMEINTDIANSENVDEEMSDELIEDIIRVEPEKGSNSHLGNEIVTETNIADDGFEFADDGIEYHEEHNYQSQLNETPEVPEIENNDDENVGSPKFDLKLLMTPVVYTTKLDQMKVYKGRSLFDTIEEQHLLDEIIIESKPVNLKSINVEQIKDDNDDIKEADDIIQVKVENTQDFDDDFFQNESSNESDSEHLEMLSSKRVKLSSSLLQKPRSRSYNPIQLCKNPDFNTRLKRLTVGFFSSQRNRVFLKACKPMTIDLSKGFESKLINGTMYLKPSDSIANKEVEDVSESAASITPSAVAVQSLMDTADVDKILQTELRKRILDRNKTINLPNISVVRQINQQLLMAEVSPIVAQVEQSAGEMKKLLNNTVILEKRNSSDTQPKKATSEISTNPDKQTLRVINSNNSKTDTVINITSPLLPMINNDKSREGKTLEKQRKKYERSQNMNRPLWSTKKGNDLRPYAESLLTIDTLYKVLNALDPTSVDYRPKTKGNQNKTIHSKPGRPVGSRIQDSSDKITTNSDNQNQLPCISQNTNPQKVNEPTTSKEMAKVPDLPKKKRSCCWARTRINKLNGKSNVREPKHKCPVAHCRCCCREILRQTEINHEIKLLEQMMQNHDEFDETIEQVVQQSRNHSNIVKSPVTQDRCSRKKQEEIDLSNVVMSSVVHVRHPRKNLANAPLIPQPKQKSIGITVGTQAFDVDDHDTVTNIQINDTDPQKNIYNVISAPENETTIDLVDDESSIQTPKPKIRVHAANPTYQTLSEIRVLKPPMMSAASPPPCDTAMTMPILPVPGGSRRSKAVVCAKTTATASKLPSKELDESDVALLPCSCRPNVALDKQSAMLVVDGSNECLRHTKSRVSKETRIYLNRKHMSAAARPFYVGKNKILLTNINPRNAQLPSPPKLPPGPLEMPEGVQIVQLPNGSISYRVDPDVKLTAEQINTMPAILAAVLQLIKAPGITLPVDDCPTQETATSTSNDGSKAIYSTSKVQDNKNMSGKNSENNNANEEVPAATTDSILENKDSSIADTVQTEIQIQEVNQEASVPENRDAKVVKNTTDTEERILSDNMFVDKETNVMGVAETESSVCLEPATKTENNASEGPEKNNQRSENESTSDPVQVSENENTTASSSRNLLSDLMEMSGILEEDVTPAQQQSSSSTAPGSIQPLTIDISQDSSIQPDSISGPPLSPNAEKHSISAQINEKMYNLNPITSFAELKYACDNNGLFFKLDLNNGVIVPINVCIQKTAESSSVKNTTPSEVIDLTDEQNLTIDEPTDTDIQVDPSSKLANPKAYSMCKLEMIQTKIKIKPRELSQMLTPRLRGRPKSILIDNTFEKFEDEDEDSQRTLKLPSKTALMKRLSNNLKPLKIQENRSSINILRKHSLLHNNTPIPKRISNLKNSTKPKIPEHLLEDSSDESDDEPLAKIAKKMRSNESEESNSQESQRVPQGEKMDEDNVDFEDAIDAISAVEPPTNINSLLRASETGEEPVPTQLVLSGAALDQPLPAMMENALSLVANESYDGDSDGDCILGV